MPGNIIKCDKVKLLMSSSFILLASFKYPYGSSFVRYLSFYVNCPCSSVVVLQI